MRIFKCKKNGVSRKFLVAASAYRRMAIRSAFHDFGLASMIEQYEFETYGIGTPDIRTNGYTYGKSLVDITLSAMIEDHQSGLFCKFELMEGSCAYIRRAIRNLPPKPFFGWHLYLKGCF